MLPQRRSPEAMTSWFSGQIFVQHRIEDCGGALKIARLNRQRFIADFSIGMFEYFVDEGTKLHLVETLRWFFQRFQTKQAFGKEAVGAHAILIELASAPQAVRAKQLGHNLDQRGSREMTRIAIVCESRRTPTCLDAPTAQCVDPRPADSILRDKPVMHSGCFRREVIVNLLSQCD